MRRLTTVASMFLVVLLGAEVCAQVGTTGVPRRADGRPDLSGTYDIATLTPLQRPEEFGEVLTLTPEDAAVFAAQAGSLERIFNIPAERNQETAPPREAPPVGGDGSSGAAGNVGGYNAFWMDFGQSAFQIDGEYRTSIIVDPPNGRRPPLSLAAQERLAARAAFARPNTGTAWWLEDDLDAPGPYDDPERRPHAERCLMGFGSTAGPPMLPVLYNNLKKIVQTDDTIMILVEMVHDARIVRMNQEHLPSGIRTWLGDSVGHWEGDTLVVDTTNLNDQPWLDSHGSFYSDQLHVVERFTRIGDDTIRYEATLEDPVVFTAPWTLRFDMARISDPGYEFFEEACSEGVTNEHRLAAGRQATAVGERVLHTHEGTVPR